MGGESDEDFAKRLQAAQYSSIEQRSSLPPTPPTSSSSSQPYRGSRLNGNYSNAHTNQNRRMNQMRVIIPNGVRSGQKFFIINPQGDQMEVICPNGSYAGDEITVEYPDRPAPTPKRDKRDCILC